MKSTLFLAATLPLFATLPGMAQDGPPGMIKIKGDRYDIGADKKEIADMIEATGFRALASEVPKHSVKLDDFYIMPTEVTNEQFAKFIAATGSEPPQSWGIEAIGAAGLAYATTTGKQKQDAKEAGLPIPEIKPFDPAKWWKENWSTSKWKIPDGQEAFPVVFINFERAESYARWAGLRLMSEEEFQAAAHGKLDRKYAWGDDADTKKINSFDSGIGGPAKVGHYPAGATWVDAQGRVVAERNDRNAKEVQGLYDLSGNAWEWTRSPFKAYPGFKPVEVKLLKKKKEELTPPFDANHRTAVGGGFNSPMITARLTTRRDTARFQATDGLGMRCTASTVPGLDIAESILRSDLPTSKRPDDTVYVADRITAIDRWDADAGKAPVPEYRVINSYNYVAFIPAEQIPVNSAMLLKDRSFKAPVEIGAFATTIPLIEPALEPGTYTLSWRAKGKFQNSGAQADGEKAAAAKSDDDQDGEVEPEFPFDPMVDTLLFRDTNGKLVAWTKVKLPDEGRLEAGRVSLSELEPKAAERAGKKAGTVLSLHVWVPSKKANKGFEYTIPLTVKSGLVTDEWRK